ncbi:MAG: GNAT family N-acetyltransferase [Oligoflexia bacterium]|nr:GNAT family N-acetyltransferase [Oligoflexia bacterium]
MKLTVPKDEDLFLTTKRLVLEPVLESHAEEMFKLLSSPKLYDFIPQDPPELEKLKESYKKWETRSSPDGSELWLNWIARLKTNGKLIGHFQAGFKDESEISVAYTIGVEFQRQGLAFEGLACVAEFLKNKLKGKIVKAFVDTRNFPSIELLKKLEFNQSGFIKNADFFKGSSSDEFLFEKSI